MPINRSIINFSIQEHRRKILLLKDILKINLNSPMENKSEERVENFSTYLEKVLINCDPNIFSHNVETGLFEITEEDEIKSEKINKAMGISLALNSAEQKALSPQFFDSNLLDELYKSDNNILWLVLKSTKPIDKTFTAQDKVRAYIELAEAFKDKKLSATKKYLGAYDMAKVALSIAEKSTDSQTLVDKSFGLESKLGQWIISKHSTENKDNVCSTLSQYAYAKHVDSIQLPTKPVISPSQGLLLLIQHYKDDSEKVLDLKKLYLVGVRVKQGQSKRSAYTVNARDKEKIDLYLSDPFLLSYDISMEKEVINNDPTRRYFETHLAFETINQNIDSFDITVLKQQEKILTEALTRVDPESMDAKTCARVFLGEINEDDSNTHKEYGNYINKIRNKELFKKLNDEQREKIILLVKCSLLGVVNAQARPNDLPLNIYKTAPLYSDNWKGKIAIEGQEETANPHMGLMKNYMPVPQFDIATSDTPAPPVKPSDQATFKKDMHVAKWVEMNFSGLVHPFSNALSGTMLCQLRNLAEQLNAAPELSSGITDSKEIMEQYSRLFISVMLYGSGGHSLNEYTFPFQLEDVCTAFKKVSGFNDINLETMFSARNADAFDSALNDTISYNSQFLKKQRVNDEIKKISLISDRSKIAKTIDIIINKEQEYKAKMKDDHLKPLTDELIKHLNKGNVKEALSISSQFIKQLGNENKSRGLGKHLSSKIIREIHESISVLETKVSLKENFISASFKTHKDKFSQLKSSKGDQSNIKLT